MQKQTEPISPVSLSQWQGRLRAILDPKAYSCAEFDKFMLNEYPSFEKVFGLLLSREQAMFLIVIGDLRKKIGVSGQTNLRKLMTYLLILVKLPKDSVNDSWRRVLIYSPYYDSLADAHASGGYPDSDDFFVCIESLLQAILQECKNAGIKTVLHHMSAECSPSDKHTLYD